MKYKFPEIVPFFNSSAKTLTDCKGGIKNQSRIHAENRTLLRVQPRYRVNHNKLSQFILVIDNFYAVMVWSGDFSPAIGEDDFSLRVQRKCSFYVSRKSLQKCTSLSGIMLQKRIYDLVKLDRSKLPNSEGSKIWKRQFILWLNLISIHFFNLNKTSAK